MASDIAAERVNQGHPPPGAAANPSGDRVDSSLKQAPLFSVSVGPVPGDLAKAFHVALFFELLTQGPPQNWTLEFDAVLNVGPGDTNVHHRLLADL